MRTKGGEAREALWPPPPWDPQPRELPAMREAMCQQLHNPYQHAETTIAMREGMGTLRPVADSPEEAASIMLADEYLRLTSARLWSVSPELTQIAVKASRNLPQWTVRRSDLPNNAATGLIVYDEPIARYINKSGMPVLIVAVSWGPTQLVADLDAGDVLWLSFWSVVDRKVMVEQVMVESLRLTGTRVSRSDAESLANQMWLSDLNWDNEALMFFDSPIVRAENTSGKPQLVEPSEKGVRGNEDIFSWVQTLRATWILLRKDGSKIVETEEQPQPRTVQRRVRRSGIEDVSPVTVARVHTSRRPRRAATTGPAGDGDGRHVSVRFPVSGHVRWQPYPSTGNVKPIWIDEHDRGPEDAPYRVGRRFRVNRLDRLPPDSTTPTPDNRK